MNISSVISRYISYIPRLLSLLHLLLPFLSIYMFIFISNSFSYILPVTLVQKHFTHC
jgi:hypothetical protein